MATSKHFPAENLHQVVYDILVDALVTIGTALSTIGAFLGSMAAMNPINWFFAQSLIATLVGGWVGFQSETYFIDKAKELIRPIFLNLNEMAEDSPEARYYTKLRKYFKYFFVLLSAAVFLSVCISPYFPALALLGEGSVIAQSLGLGAAQIPYLAAALSLLTYISQTFIYAACKVAKFGFNNVTNLLFPEKNCAQEMLPQQEASPSTSNIVSPQPQYSTTYICSRCQLKSTISITSEITTNPTKDQTPFDGRQVANPPPKAEEKDWADINDPTSYTAKSSTPTPS